MVAVSNVNDPSTGAVAGHVVYRVVLCAYVRSYVPYRDKTSDEEALEGEVEALRVKLEGLKELEPGETDTLEQLAKELDDKEKALYRLQVGRG